MVNNLNFGNIWYNSFLSKYNLNSKISGDEKNEIPSFKEILITSEAKESEPIDNVTIEFNKEYLKSKLDFRKKIIENILSEKGIE